jgi:hypothetical protein
MNERAMEYDFHDYAVTIEALVTAPSEEEAREALERSGLTAGALIGETMIENVEVET